MAEEYDIPQDLCDVGVSVAKARRFAREMGRWGTYRKAKRAHKEYTNQQSAYWDKIHALYPETIIGEWTADQGEHKIYRTKGAK